MNIENFKNIYFVGIGGIGMSAIARYFKAIGKNVFGYDRTQTLLTGELEKEGIDIIFSDDLDQIPEIYLNKEETLVVYTPAIPSSHKQLSFFKIEEFALMKRAQVLGLLSDPLNGIGIAGTHGKTTVSSLTAHIFKNSTHECNAFLGGIARNYNTNLLLSKKSKWVVIEADEFDRSFLQLHPQVAVVTSMDADHLDIYGKKEELEKTFQNYVGQIKKDGHLVYKKGLPLNPKEINLHSYSLEEEADFYAKNLKLEKGLYQFDLVHPKGCIKGLKLSYPGRINVENAVAASAVALICGISENELRLALNNFLGVRRRFDYRIKSDNLVFIDDYAHHPKELWESISSVRAIYPDKKITGIFQPHLFTRTRDFADDFAKSLDLLDELILLDIYPARELPIKGVDSNLILSKMKKKGLLCTKNELIKRIEQSEIEVLLTLGAGDIDKLVEPIEQVLNQRIKC
ncbi:UDP-N-acetylmuramate--L-alanine ligase [Ancylomarina sp. 16SWW S1-10-2]|uniref:UDP-N-acetylmuramate--L-alanine ligase n=1 Tax=Ancylomarina sp. 16SWW S1-10-2 TaxID=2499681 RepID=UPI0012AD5200|nr:UDP-N-acetylmuramate--L-alanine ligase [Ancylomarina sp. 16SWW S1-10-2]MRT94189.1 UDP-N-acetylmuramate--L-alanine ligase [Ancylomarina sp. 16SWW S1-10-2]